MKILFLDIEVSPLIVTVWGLANNNYISPDKIMGNSEVLCWAAKWAGEDKTYFSSKKTTTKTRMLKAIYRMLEQADVVVSYNGNSFDLKILNKEFALQGWGPPSPYKSMDILLAIRKKFRFTSNKLGYITQMLGLGDKTQHAGYQLWLDCMNPKSTDYEASWATMEEYNIQDVALLETLYARLKGWIPNHPNFSAHQDGAHVCPGCGGTHLEKRGFLMAISQKYQRYKCNDCGKWSRARSPVKVDRSNQLVGIN